MEVRAETSSMPDNIKVRKVFFVVCTSLVMTYIPCRYRSSVAELTTVQYTTYQSEVFLIVYF